MDIVLPNEEAFKGPYAELGPDVVCVPAEGYFLTYVDAEASDGLVVPKRKNLSGWHRMEGIFAAMGPKIRSGRSGGGERPYSLLDLVPTFLYLLGEPIPQGLDGGIMKAILVPGLLEKDPPRSAPPLEEDYREMSPEELENLKNIPYIGG